MTTRVGAALVVVPAWNEEASVGSVVDDVVARGYPVLVVDDGSTDATAPVARQAGARVLRLPVNLGVGGALRTGFRWAVEHGYDTVVQIDADGQHPVDAIGRLVQALDDSRAHLVVGSRFVEGARDEAVGALRRLAMRLLARSATRAAGVRVTDATSGLRAIREPLLTEFSRAFSAHYLGDTYEALVSAGRGGYRITEIPVEMSARTHGQSSASSLAALQFFIRSVILVVARLQVAIRPATEDRADEPVRPLEGH